MKEDFEDILVAFRCGDHGCMFGSHGGMGTNGGCAHDKMDQHELRRSFRKLANGLRYMARKDEVRKPECPTCGGVCPNCGMLRLHRVSCPSLG